MKFNIDSLTIIIELIIIILIILKRIKFWFLWNHWQWWFLIFEIMIWPIRRLTNEIIRDIPDVSGHSMIREALIILAKDSCMLVNANTPWSKSSLIFIWISAWTLDQSRSRRTSLGYLVNQSVNHIKWLISQVHFMHWLNYRLLWGCSMESSWRRKGWIEPLVNIERIIGGVVILTVILDVIFIGILIGILLILMKIRILVEIRMIYGRWWSIIWSFSFSWKSFSGMIFNQNDQIRSHFAENCLSFCYETNHFVYSSFFYSKQHFDRVGWKQMTVHLM